MDDLVLRAMRLAERVHRENNHFRKAPDGLDRPAYFLHLAEVAWILQEGGLSDEVVAAGYLHDMLEDCGYTQQQLSDEIESDVVADFVTWVSEPEKDKSWEERNTAYINKLRSASIDVLSLSCADKTSNLRDMGRLLDQGYSLGDVLSRGLEDQVVKFSQLDDLFSGAVADTVYRRYQKAYQRLIRGLEESSLINGEWLITESSDHGHFSLEVVHQLRCRDSDGNELASLEVCIGPDDVTLIDLASNSERLSYRGPYRYEKESPWQAFIKIILERDIPRPSPHQLVEIKSLFGNIGV